MTRLQPDRRVMGVLALALVASGLGACILLEDPDDLEAVEVIGADASADVIVDDDGVPLQPCSADNARSCGAACVDCADLPGIDRVSCLAGACRVDACVAGLVDCDGLATNGCEQAEHARACGATCVDCLERPGSVDGVCVDGACELRCEAGRLDCDGSPQSGCEATERDRACGAACLDCAALEGVASARCALGACLIDACVAGRLDCDGLVETGCEGEEGPATCGPGCGLDCAALANVARSRCVDGRCALTRCRGGWRDLDRDVDTGCEAPCALAACWRPPPGALTDIAVHADGLRALLVGARTVLLADDGGERWWPRPTPLAVDLRAVALDDEVALALGADALLRSDDGGASWQVVALPADVAELRAVALDGPLAVIVGPGALLVSDDAGRTWRAASEPVADLDLRAAAVRGGVVFLGGVDGRLLVSRDAGATFSATRLPGAATLRFFAFGPDDAVYSGGNAFLLRSRSGGDAWEALDVPAANWIDLDVDGERLLLVAADRYALREAPGDPFSVRVLPDGDALSAGALTARGVLLGGREPGGHGVLIEARLGGAQTPLERLTLAREGRDLAWALLLGERLVVGGADGAWRSDLGDGRWRQVSSPALVDRPPLVAVRAGAQIVAGAADGPLVHTADGATWETAPGARLDALSALVADGARVVAAGALDGHPALLIGAPPDEPLVALDCATRDGCALGGDAAARAVAAHGDALALVSDAGALSVSADGGATWSAHLSPAGVRLRDVHLSAAGLAAWGLDALDQPHLYHAADLTDAALTPRLSLAPGADLRGWTWRGTRGVALDDAGAALVTDDGGRRWRPLPLTPDAPFALAAIDGAQRLLVTDAGQLFVSVDAGQTFTTHALDLGGAIPRALTPGRALTLLLASDGLLWQAQRPLTSPGD